MNKVRSFINIVFNGLEYSNILRKINSFDIYLLDIIKKYIENRYLDKLMPVITSFGDLGVIWIVMAIILSLDKNYRVVGCMVFITLIISTILGEVVIKHLVRRFRPCTKDDDIKLLIKRPLSYSFPSGHALSSFAVANVMSTFFVQYKIIFIAIAFLIALSRLYLYVHYPTDVIAGIIFGIICSKLIFIII